jgi:eukaryotic-like serine/threonine-protein kinase
MSETGKTLGRYEILGTLGRGAMGVVFRARDPLIDRVVAIKQVALPPAFSDVQREEFTRRFFGEAKAAGRLRHPNVVTVYDLGVEDGKPFMAMELVEGESLSQILKARGALPPQEALAIARQVALGLAYAHEQGVVHRDIKPDNILVDREGRPVITDFGVAHLESSDLTRTGEVLGTPHFMSPEQVKGEPLDGRSDLFSLGVVLFEMLTGQRPFRGDTISTICYQIVHAAPKPDLSQLDVPLPVGKVLAGLLAKDRKDRFADGHAAAQAMDAALAWLGGGETRAMAPTPRTGTSPRTESLSEARTLPGPALAPTVVSPARPAASARPAKSSASRVFVGVLAVLVALLVLLVLGGILKGVQHRRAESLAAAKSKSAVPEHRTVSDQSKAPDEQPPDQNLAPVAPKLQPAGGEPHQDSANTVPTVQRPSPKPPAAQAARPARSAVVPVTVELVGPIMGGGYGIFVDGEMKRQAAIHGSPNGMESSKPGFRVTETLEVPVGPHTLRFAVRPAFSGTAFVKDWVVVLEEGHPLTLSVMAHPRKSELVVREGTGHRTSGE